MRIIAAASRSSIQAQRSPIYPLGFSHRRGRSPVGIVGLLLTLLALALALLVFSGSRLLNINDGINTSNSRSQQEPCPPQTKPSVSPKANDLVYAIDVQQTRSWIRRQWKKYQNNADFHGLERVFRMVHMVGKDVSQSTVLVGGTNDGQGALKILQNSPSVSLHGFEIQKAHYQTAAESLKRYKFVKMHNLGWDEVPASEKQIAGEGETAGFYDPRGQRGFTLTNETISTVALAEWAAKNGIDTVLYVLIDTEGYEGRVIRGMRLERVENRKRFPLFQYELGGTWAALDSRHASEPWTQQTTARYLEDKGYLLFLVGEEDWLLVNAEVFSTSGRTGNVAAHDEGYGPFIQGNVLALHPEYIFYPLKKRIFERTAVVGKLAAPR